MLDEFNIDSYTHPRFEMKEPETPEIHLDVDPEPHVFGIKPHAPRSDLPFTTMEAMEQFKPHSDITVGNVIWMLLVGWWVALFFIITGILLLVTIIGWQEALFCFRMASYIAYPFGRYAARDTNMITSTSCVSRFLMYLFIPIIAIPTFLGIFLSWEVVFYIPMAKFLFSCLKLCFKNPTNIKIYKCQNHNPQRGHFPVLLIQSSGSKLYFKFSLFTFEVVYLNLIPFVIMSFIVGFIEFPEGNFLNNSMFGTCMSLIGAIPCAYMIGICVDDLSHTLGIITGSIINSLFLSIVELILYGLSLAKNLANVVRAAVTGAFLMNLLIIPGVGMLAAGIKWSEVVLNKKSQSISGTMLLLAIVSVLFPSIFYHVHSTTSMACGQCTGADFNLTGTNASAALWNCTGCNSDELHNLELDPIYVNYAKPLMFIMAFMMPVIYIVGVCFSVKTHKHIFEPHVEGEEHSSAMKTSIAIVVLIIATVCFSLMAHVMTEKIPHVIDQLHLSERFVGLVFYTLIPNCAEYMNAIKFAVNGNIGLSMEIGNQGAILTAFVEMPAIVLLSYIMHKFWNYEMFTLIFPLIDIFCTIVAVFLRNSILTEKSINYFTGTSFLIIFLLISVVYYFEVF